MTGAPSTAAPAADPVLDGLAGFASSLEAADLGSETVHQAKRRIVDAVGCWIGGSGEGPAHIARVVVGGCHGPLEATVAGVDRPVSLELAAFANTVMTRYLDFNDTTFTDGGGGGHFSDMIPGLVATAEAVGATGGELVTSVVLAYEIAAGLASVARVRERGWDYATWITPAVALAGGRLLGLDRAQLAHAAALSVTSNIATRQMRVGELSMWKGCASAWASRNGVFAALLAKAGITAPPAPFAGKDGIMDLVTGCRFEPPLTAGSVPSTYAVETSNFKVFPSGYNTQGPCQMMIEARRQVEPDEVESIDVDTYWLCYSENGMEPEKWRPQTRETADHSLPYVMARGYMDGGVNFRSFEEDRYLDPEIRRFMEKIRVRELPEFSERFPGELNNRITFHRKGKPDVVMHSTYGYGHHRNPPDDAALTTKFEEQCAPCGDPAAIQAILAALWALDDQADVGSWLRRLCHLEMPPQTTERRAAEC